MMDFLTQLIERGGYAGIVLLTFIETIVLPLPSEIFMPMAGYVASRGTLSLPGAIAAGTVGSLIGAMAWYSLGRAIGLDRMRALAARHGRWLTLHPADIDRGNDWFMRHGGMAVLLGRMIPGIRAVVSIPAGIAHMPLWRFLLLTAIGSLVWTSVLMVVGYHLGSNYGDVAGWAGPVSNVVFGGLLVIYLWRLVTFKAR